MWESEKQIFEERGTALIALNIDEAPRAVVVKGFAEQQGFTFRILLSKTEERNYEVDSAYQVVMTPSAYVIDRGGKILFSHVGALNAKELKEALSSLPAAE